MMNQHDSLVNAITKHDIAESKKSHYNRYALGIMLGALHDAEDAMTGRGVPARQAIIRHFNGRLCDKLLKSIGEKPHSTFETAQARLGTDIL